MWRQVRVIGVAVTMTHSPWRSPIPWILIAIAFVQFISAHIAGLTPWKGGGFGMFASIDSAEGRFLAVSGHDAQRRQYRVVIQAGDSIGPVPASAVARTRMAPSRERLLRVARAVLRLPLMPARNARRSPPQKLSAVLASRQLPEPLEIVRGAAANAQTIRLESVEVAVLRICMDRRSDSVYLSPVIPGVAIHTDVGSDERR